MLRKGLAVPWKPVDLRQAAVTPIAGDDAHLAHAARKLVGPSSRAGSVGGTGGLQRAAARG